MSRRRGDENLSWQVLKCLQLSERRAVPQPSEKILGSLWNETWRHHRKTFSARHSKPMDVSSSTPCVLRSLSTCLLDCNSDVKHSCLGTKVYGKRKTGLAAPSIINMVLTPHRDGHQAGDGTRAGAATPHPSPAPIGFGSVKSLRGFWNRDKTASTA